MLTRIMVPVPSPFSLPKKRSFSSQCSFKVSFDDNQSNETYCSNFSRRLALFQLGTAIPQSQVLGVKASELLRPAESTVETNNVRNVAAMNSNLTEDSALQWAKKDKRKMLHVVYRVGDLDKTIKFYTECFGMKLLRKRDIPEERYSNAFLGYGPEDSHFTVELTYNYGVDKYNIGNGLRHFGIRVDSVEKVVNLVKAKGGKVIKEPALLNGSSKVIAYVEDPDGYKFELSKEATAPEPLHHVMLCVGNLDRSINFYKKAFGMDLLSKQDNPELKYAEVTLGYGAEDMNPVLKLAYNYGISVYDKGDGYAQIAIGTDDVYKTAEAIKLFDGMIAREPGPLPGINTKITVCLDPDGWKSVFVDNVDFLKELE
ncbi:probable lactoylglutathione lyase, chloroplastic isoform X1 [Rhodamnia argentea]|uniref:lactoylglutathione lyase n=1 Tax=Rhodamnia argentea TaxID=178133 RepID=A0A8B8P7H9_9MYRT|nr:probable lactoylglutathione lyase, chloroplastic isoform X1 [Rhodamnia argentea]XP_030530722.1 probable lactoylglutathione lyase, chloroplastic isoform X1 [Rhodamnia argentea]XP_048133406.1 probable lactoylglutathione lyase, chloroplastic isoform X1 [Rhodamnia argentea]